MNERSTPLGTAPEPVGRPTVVVGGLMLIIGLTGCTPSDHDPYGTSRQVCAAVPLDVIAPVLDDPAPGEPQRVFGSDMVGRCVWRGSAGDSLRLTATTDSLGVAHARGSLNPGQPAPGIASYATIETTASRSSWTTRIDVWVGDADTFEVYIVTDSRPVEDTLTTVGRDIVERLPDSGAYRPS